MSRLHIVSLIITLFFTGLLVATEESEEDKQEKKENFSKADVVHQKIQAMVREADAKRSEELPRCDDQAVVAGIKKHYVAGTKRSVPLFYFPHIEGFKEDTDGVAGEKTKGPWTWLDDGLRKRFEPLSARYERGGAGISSYLEWLKETFEEAPHVAFLLPFEHDEVSSRMPTLDEKNKQFEGGVLVARLLLMATKSAKIACANVVLAQSSDTIKFHKRKARLTRLGRIMEKMREKSPEKALKQDFEKQVYAALKKALPEGLKPKVNFGP